jgi:hypothetical protein
MLSLLGTRYPLVCWSDHSEIVGSIIHIFAPIKKNLSFWLLEDVPVALIARDGALYRHRCPGLRSRWNCGSWHIEAYIWWN